MSTDATEPTSASTPAAPDASSPVQDKGKGKVADESMEDDEEDEEEEEEDDGGEEEDRRGGGGGEPLFSPLFDASSLERVLTRHQDSLQEIDPNAIQPRRTRGVKVDYTSAEALAKAGLTANDEDDEDDKDVEMKDE
ncbi:CHZ domain-containing protein [Mycena kentingensis (nom. inval.)]|nr:CHZ domain-containing protein [Mycena kentingensis (nom. inval.)]